MRILGMLKADNTPKPARRRARSSWSEWERSSRRSRRPVCCRQRRPASQRERQAGALAGGKVTIIDGPFTESKELVASYALFQVKSMDEAIHWTKRFLEVLGEGECELRRSSRLRTSPRRSSRPMSGARGEDARANAQERQALVGGVGRVSRRRNPPCPRTTNSARPCPTLRRRMPQIDPPPWRRHLTPIARSKPYSASSRPGSSPGSRAMVRDVGLAEELAQDALVSRWSSGRSPASPTSPAPG